MSGPAPLTEAPLTEEEVARLAAAVGLDLPAECLPGVAATLASLAEHAARVQAPA